MIPPGKRTTPQAVWIPAPAAGVLARAARGTVLAIFERSAYLDLGGRVLALASVSLGRGPLTVSIMGFEDLVPLEAGQPVELSGGVLRIGGRSVDLRRAAVWDPALHLVEHVAPALLAAALSAAIDELLCRAPDGSIVPLLGGHPARGSGRAPALLLEALRRGLETVAALLEGPRDPADAAREAATWIAGRGPGLTPSGDDLLIGIMHAITVWPSLAARTRRAEGSVGNAGGADIRVLLAGAARGHTTRISAAHLDAAAHGWAAEAWHDLVRSLHVSPAAVRNAVRRLLRVGETSGADALTGFCWAWRRLAA